jgi:hypothetical protein
MLERLAYGECEKVLAQTQDIDQCQKESAGDRRALACRRRTRKWQGSDVEENVIA